MNEFIEVKTDGRRQLIRTTEIMRVEEGLSGNALLHTDSWDKEPLETDNAYEEVIIAIGAHA